MSNQSDEELFDGITPDAKKRADTMVENALITAAQHSDDDQEASDAMKLLREHYDPTYGWCEDCDGLVCKEKDCCMNQIGTALRIEAEILSPKVKDCSGKPDGPKAGTPKETK